MKRILQSAEGKKNYFRNWNAIKICKHRRQQRALTSLSHTLIHNYSSLLPSDAHYPPPPFPCSGPVSMSWQIFNELHYLRVLSSGWGLPRLQQQWRKNRYFQLCPGLEKQKICWKSKRQKKSRETKKKWANERQLKHGCRRLRRWVIQNLRYDWLCTDRCLN